MHHVFKEHDVLIYNIKGDFSGFAWVRKAGEDAETPGEEGTTLGTFASLPLAVGEARKRGFKIQYWADPLCGVPLDCRQITTPFDSKEDSP